MKICNSCKIEKNLIEFNKHPSTKDGFKNQCKFCVSEYEIIRYIKNKENVKLKSNEYYLNNKIKVIKRINIYTKNKLLNNSLFKLKCSTRVLIGKSIKKQGYSKTSKTHQILGCSFEDFKTHLQNQFTKGMNWENAGEWHLDHIYPVSLAKSEEELIQLNHYTNFQPLWALDNLKKGNKIIDNKQLKLI